MKRFLPVLLVLAAATPVRAQDDVVRRYYAEIQNGVRAEYQAFTAQVDRQEVWPSMSEEETAKRKERVDRRKNSNRTFAYNKAVLMAVCAADAERAHAAGVPPVPPEQNLVLRTCVETKLELLRKFANTSGYVDRFFPQRLAPCEKRARLADLEKALPPYAFLELPGFPEPKLYDFELYNRCLMTMP